MEIQVVYFLTLQQFITYLGFIPMCFFIDDSGKLPLLQICGENNHRCFSFTPGPAFFQKKFRSPMTVHDLNKEVPIEN